MATTTNLTFTLLDLNDTAGYNSINTVITSIDNKLRYRTISPNMIIIWDANPAINGGVTYPTNVPTGWTGLGQSVGGLPTLSGNYYWIQKSTTL